MARQHGLNFADDRQRNRLGRTRTDVEPHRAIEAIAELPGLVADVVHQSHASRRRAEQADVGNGTVGERSQIELVRGQVMAHDDCGVVMSVLKLFRQRVRRIQHDLLRPRKPVGDRVCGPMIEYIDMPAHQAGDLHQRHRVRSGFFHERL